MLIRNLSGLFTCKGFVENEGRHPTLSQADFVQGPVDIYLVDGMVEEIGRGLIVPSDCEVVDGCGKVALPGFVDSHTHALFSGDRSGEFFQRWAGQDYVKISNAGGGIKATQRRMAETPDEVLIHDLVERLKRMRKSGTRVVEIKSGYGRCADEELRHLRVIQAAASKVDEMTVMPTFLGLHAIPKGRTEDEYTDEMISVLPWIAQEGLAVFADSFPEGGFFSLESALRFSRSAQEAGLQVKVHADELTDLGTSTAFIKIGATSIDHLQHISAEAVELLSTADTVATLLPATSFYLGLPYANARRLLDEGARLALATDFNPGTAPCNDLGFTALLAAANFRLTAAEILCALTVNAAAALGHASGLGNIQVGARAGIQYFECGNSTIHGSILESLIINGERPETQWPVHVI